MHTANGWRTIAGAVVFALGSSAARADQCAWVDPATAERAAALIRESRSILEWCQPCGERQPAHPAEAVESVEIRAAGSPEFREVWVNGRAQDLAYLYVRSGADTYKNVSKAVACPSTGVTAEVHVAVGGQVSPVAAQPKTLVGVVKGVEEGDHARCIVRSEGKRLVLHNGRDFHGRCREALGAEVRVTYTEEPSPDEPTGDVMVLHRLEVLHASAP